ncbi:MAG: TonB-dependent receptor, partial [Hymenobacteraceae bacterium]|nr:TonB-dependent receptor [Hymenobacteraceae bacterium]MDX5397819.1 TonB-dependent receptor [Hymenobacteraceae bacterium]MDX5513898.1 TonB-dependent receptor [Hymenobacteraceae bacterium]
MKTRISSFFLLFFVIWLALPAQAQQRFSISGYVRDAGSGENLTGATIRVKENAQIGTASNNYGFYSITLPAGDYTLVAQFIGYQPQEKKIKLNQNQTINFNLSAETYEAQTVEIVADRAQQQVESTQMGEIVLPMEQLKTLPVLFGETDVLKMVQLMPGVKSGGEGNTGFYVRGGGADQNLVLLDEATVYNPGHMLNFFSVFNSDALRNTTLIKGSMPARCGGRLSSVLDISMKEGNKKEFQAEGGVGLIASRLTVQGPIVKDKASFILSGRRTYLDQLINPFLKNTEQGGLPYYFYDLNAKVNYELNDRNRFYISSYFGRDKGSFNLSDGQFVADFNWGNATVTSRWNHVFSNKLFMNLSAVFTDYQFVFDADFEGYTSRLFTGVKDYQLKADFEYFPDVKHQVQYGATYTWHTLRPRNASARNAEGIEYGTTYVEDKFAHEAAVYVSDDWTLTDALTVNLGLRGSYFKQVGPFTFYNFKENGEVADSTIYRSGETVRDFQTLEPRLSLRYQLSSGSSIK